MIETPPLVETDRLEREKSQGIDSSKTSSSLKTSEDVKAHLENQLKQARMAAQQVGGSRMHCCVTTLIIFFTCSRKALRSFRDGKRLLVA